MFKSRLIIPKENIVGSKIFLPITICYEIHSATINQNGLLNEEFENFEIKPPYIDFSSDISDLKSYSDPLSLDVNYHYKKSPYDQVCQDFSNSVITASWFGNPINLSPDIESKRKEIFIKHYIDANFALDSGLYKESVLNFGTCLEVILNRELENEKLMNLINSCDSSLSSFETEMHKIRTLRNRVHPNQLNSFNDISRKDSYECRVILERILNQLIILA